MLQTTKSSKNLPSLIDVAECDEVDIVCDSGDYEDKTVEKSSSKNSNRAMGFLIPKARLAFNKLRKAFTKAPILQHFNPKYYIWIQTDASGYVIGKVLSQLTSNDSGQWKPIVYYSQKMILAKTWYKTHNSKLLAIVKAFKT